MNAGQRIKEKREELGMTQEDLALKLGYKSRSSVNKVERTRDLSLKLVNQYAEALGCSATYLLGWEDMPNNSTIRPLNANVALVDFNINHKFSQLNEQNQKTILNMIDALLLQQQKTK